MGSGFPKALIGRRPEDYHVTRTRSLPEAKPLHCGYRILDGSLGTHASVRASNLNPYITLVGLRVEGLGCRAVGLACISSSIFASI